MIIVKNMLFPANSDRVLVFRSMFLPPLKTIIYQGESLEDTAVNEITRY